MGRTELKTCDICGIPLSMEGEFGRQIRSYNGLEVTIGGSRGGWGHRENYVHFSGEVCQECFDAIRQHERAINNEIKKRIGTRTPKKGFTGQEQPESAPKTILSKLLGWGV